MTSVLPSRSAVGTYSFASQPKVVSKKKIYRDNLDEDVNYNYGNLMFDRRVIRGNTYALHVLPAHAQPDPLEIQKQIERKRNAAARRKLREELRPKSPLPLDGRIHKPVQTELYLEALTDYVEEIDEECQTDVFLDRPPTPHYVPAKVGMDVMTQIYEGDLFDFDLEVKPILEVLIGKTIEQSLLEIAEEEELASIRAQQNAFEEIRQADLLEVARLAERERRIQEEKERRKAQFLAVAEQERELAVKVAAQAFAKAYLSDLQPHVFSILSENGYFYDPIERDIEEGFLPWLMEEIDEQLELENDARLLLDGMIREVVQERHHEYRQLELMAAEMALIQEAGAALTGKLDKENSNKEDSGNVDVSSPSVEVQEYEKHSNEQPEKDYANDEDPVEEEAEGEKDELNNELNDPVEEGTDEE
ncbi:unnamed protein product [Trichobilharzia szidati]|nr:unnamed protein product [Trichobilharzia szidati]